LNEQRPRVVIFVEFYLPGFRAGGPMRSVSALVEQVGSEIDCYVVTRDRDEGSDRPYPDVPVGEWTTVGCAKVLYLAPHQIRSRRLTKAVRDIEPQAIYLNGFFGPMATRVLLARRLGALANIPVLLAPRGELSPGALRLKRSKKRWFLAAAKWMGLYSGVVFQASTERERDEINRAIPLTETPYIARNPIAFCPAVRSRSKTSGAARFVFVSRIARKKNLHVALDLLRTIRGAVAFDIYGPIVEEEYWAECRPILDAMPANVVATYRGAVSHGDVAAALAASDFFLLPTASENFGHAIVEALMAGLPVITSDQTPWVGLARHGAGWDLALGNVDLWRAILQQCVDMDRTAYEQATAAAQAFGQQIGSADTAAENLRMLKSILDRSGRAPLAGTAAA
jgi:glycosyltransferase involved in cell wall biosynthesis